MTQIVKSQEDKDQKNSQEFKTDLFDQLSMISNRSGIHLLTDNHQSQLATVLHGS